MLFEKTGNPYSKFPSSFPPHEECFTVCVNIAALLLGQYLEKENAKITEEECFEVITGSYISIIEALIGDLVDDGTSYEDCMIEIANTVAVAAHNDYLTAINHEYEDGV